MCEEMRNKGIPGPESSWRTMFEKAFDTENVEALKKAIASMRTQIQLIIQGYDARQAAEVPSPLVPARLRLPPRRPRLQQRILLLLFRLVFHSQLLSQKPEKSDDSAPEPPRRQNYCHCFRRWRAGASRFPQKASQFALTSVSEN